MRKKIETNKRELVALINVCTCVFACVFLVGKVWSVICTFEIPWSYHLLSKMNNLC